MTAQILTFTPRETQYAPPRHSDADRLGDAWRIMGADLANDALWVREYSRALKSGSMSVTYRTIIEKRLAAHIRNYLAGLRQVYEIECEMEREGVQFMREGAW